MNTLDVELPADLRLDQLSQGQKLRLLWTLWGDLSSARDETTELPVWQTELLQQRSQAVEEGREQFIDFEDGIKELRARLS
jgi:hypothetical protein